MKNKKISALLLVMAMLVALVVPVQAETTTRQLISGNTGSNIATYYSTHLGQTITVLPNTAATVTTTMSPDEANELNTGDLGILWDTNALIWYATDSGQPVITVDLGKEFMVDGADMETAVMGSAIQQTTKVTVEYSTDNATWHTAKEITEWTKTSKWTGAEDSKYFALFVGQFTPVKARYVRFTTAGARQPLIGEVIVFGSEVPVEEPDEEWPTTRQLISGNNGSNIATYYSTYLGQTITVLQNTAATVTSDKNSDEASKLNTGDLGALTSDAIWYGMDSGQPVITVDLGKEFMVDGADMETAARGYSYQITTQVKVEYSTDNATWHTAKEITEWTKTVAMNGAEDSQFCALFVGQFEPVKARYVRFTTAGARQPIVKEVLVFGEEIVVLGATAPVFVNGDGDEYDGDTLYAKTKISGGNGKLVVAEYEDGTEQVLKAIYIANETTGDVSLDLSTPAADAFAEGKGVFKAFVFKTIETLELLSDTVAEIDFADF